MAGAFDDLTVRRASVLDRLSTGVQVDPTERDALNNEYINRQSEFRKGLRRFGYNATATSKAFIGGLAEPFAPEFAERQFADAEQTIRNQPASVQPAVPTFRDVNSLRSAVSYASGALGEGLGSVGSIVAAGLLTRGAALRATPAVRNAAQYAGGAAAALPLEGGETALTLRQNPEALANTTPAERAALTLGRGAVSGALESVVPTALLTNAVSGAVGRIAAGARPALTNVARKSAAGAVGEAGTEAAQEFTGQAAENIAVPGTGYDSERALEAAVRGAITGGVLGGAGGTVQAVRSNIDAAADTAREAAGSSEGLLNAAVERIDNVIRNPEEFGYDLTDATLGAIAEAQSRAGDAAEAAGPALANGMDAIAGLRRQLDTGMLRRLSPENRRKYAELTQNFRLLKPTEYSRLRDALAGGDTDTINEAVGDVAAQLRERVPRETLAGLQNLAQWGRQFGRGVTNAAREGRRAAQSYGREDIVRFRAFLADQHPAVLRTMDNTDASDQLARVLMTYRDNAQLLNTQLRPNDRAAIEYFREQTGVELQDVLLDARNWANENVTRREREAAFETSTGDSQLSRINEGMERLLTDELRSQYEAEGVEIGPGAVYRDDGEQMNEEDTRRTPFNSLAVVRRTLAAGNQQPRPEFTLPATLTSEQLTPEQIGRLLGGKRTSNRGTRAQADWVQELVELTPEQIAQNVTENGYRQNFNSIDIAAQAGTPQERGGARENFEGFVPEFDGTNRDLNIQGYRLLAAISSLHSTGIEIPRNEIDPALLEEFGLEPDGDPIQINVDMDPNTLSDDTVVQVGRKRTTIGDLSGANRVARSLPRQLELLQSLGGAPPQRALRALRRQPGLKGKTADAVNRGLYAFALREEQNAGRDLEALGAVERSEVVDSYAPTYIANLERRITDSAIIARDRENQRRLNDGLRGGLFTPEQVDEAIAVLERAYTPAERANYAREQRQLEEATSPEEYEAVELSDVDPDRLSAEDEVLAWVDGLDLKYETTNDLVDTLVEFRDDGLNVYELQQEAFDRDPESEDTPQQAFDAFRRSPEGQETTLRQRGIDRQLDAAQPELPNSDAVLVAEAKAAAQEANEGIAQQESLERATEARRGAAEAREEQNVPVDPRESIQRLYGSAREKVVLRDQQNNIMDFTPPAAGEFTIYGERFVVHPESDGSRNWAVSHADTGRAVQTSGRKATTISAAAEAAIARLEAVDGNRLVAALDRIRAEQAEEAVSEETTENVEQEPPAEPPQDEPPTPPPPPDDDARAQFVATVKRLLGNRVRVEFDQKLPEGVAAEYESRLGLDLEDTGKALKHTRDKRRAELRTLKEKRAGMEREGEEDPRTVAQIEDSIQLLNQQELEYLADLAVRGTIRVASGMEAQAGLAEHESFHAAFAFFFGQDNAADRRVVTTAVTKGVVGRRLRNYFRDNEEVLAVIDPTSPDFVAEEAAAYAFQVFLHEPEALQLGQQLDGVFNRFLAFLQRLVGYKTYEERARMIFNDLNSGRRAERGVSVLRDRVGMEQSMLSRSQDFVRGVGTGFMHMYDTVFSSTYSRMADSGNAAMAQIARLGYNETGAEGQGMIQRQRHETTRLSNRLKDALHALTPEELTELNRAMVLGDELTGRMGDAQQKLRKLLADVHSYQTEAGVQLGFIEDYYPMIWSPEKVAANYNGFIAMLNQYPEQLAEMNVTADELAEKIASYTERGHEFQGVFNTQGEPVADSSRRRSLDFIDRSEREAFVEDDLVVTMAHYLNQSVRHAEYVRAYGQNGERLNRLLAETRSVYGGSLDDVELAKDYIDGLMGNKEVGMSRELKDVYGAMTVYQNVRLLPLSVFSSLVDPLGIAIRTNDIGGAFDAFTYSIRNLFTDFRNQWSADQWEQYAADMGTIDMSGTVKSIDKIYTGVTLRGKTRAINDAFFRYNLLNGWVKNNHIMATKSAQLFLRRSAEGMFGEQRSADNLQEVGVRPEDIVFDDQLGRIRSTVPEILSIENSELEAFEQANPQVVADARAQAERIQRAVQKIVRQSMIQPSSAELPNWMSNPYLAPIAHLKTFVFGFNATVLNRLLYEAQRGNYSPIYYAAAYVPGMIAADFLKGLAGNGGEEPEWKKNWTAGDYIEHGVHRSGLTGTGQFFTDMGNDVNRGGGGWESLAGPSIEQAKDLMGAMQAKTSEPTQTWMINALPVNDLYDQWLRD